MKVAYILGVFPKASERFISREIFELRRQGVELKVLALSSGDKKNFGEVEIKEINAALPEYQPPIWSHRVAPLKLYYLATRGNRILPFSIKVMKETGLLGWPRAAWGLRGVYHFARIVEREKADLIHAHFLSLPSLCAAFASSITGVPFTVSAHARDVFVPAPYLGLVASRARRVVCCNTASFAELAKRGVGSALIHHGLALGPERLARAFKEPFTIITGGRFVEKKNFGFVIDVLKALREKNVSCELKLLGDGVMRDKLKAKARELGLARVVSFPGWMDTDTFRRELGEADVFVMAPRAAADGDREGIPNVLLEAMAAKVPAVVNDFPPLPEVARNGETALVVKSGRAEDFADAIMTLTDGALVKKITSGAYALLEREFDIAKNAARLVKVFEAAIKNA